MDSNDEYLKGCEAFEAKNYVDAIHHFTKAINNDPDDIASLIKRSEVFLEIDDNESFKSDLLLQVNIYSRRLKEQPNDDTLFVKRAELFKLLGFEKHASADYEKAILINPESIDAHIGLAILKTFQGSGELDGALELFSKVLEWQPDNSKALYHIALIYSKQSIFDKSILYYKRCIETGGDYEAVACRSLTSLYSKLNRFDEAIVCIRNLLCNNSGFASDYMHLANLYVKIMAFDEAQLFLNVALAIEPVDKYLFFQASKLFLKTNHLSRSIECIDEAIKLERSEPFLQFKTKLEQILKAASNENIQ